MKVNKYILLVTDLGPPLVTTQKGSPETIEPSKPGSLTWSLIQRTTVSTEPRAEKYPPHSSPRILSITLSILVYDPSGEHSYDSRDPRIREEVMNSSLES